MLLAMTYIFAIIFTQLLAGREDSGAQFDTVPQSGNTLLLQVLCGFDSDFAMKMFAINWMYYALFMTYMFMGNLTLLNMLIGVLCDVLANVATEAEQETFEADV